MILSRHYLVCLFNTICLAISFCESVSSCLYAFSHMYKSGIIKYVYTYLEAQNVNGPCFTPPQKKIRPKNLAAIFSAKFGWQNVRKI